jgi:hypothetical protein
MGVHIGKVTSEVVPTPEPPAAPSAGPGYGWEEIDKLRSNAEQMIRDQLRTCAEGFND